MLCVFRDEALIRTVEPAIARRGFSLLRARSRMQGFWMAVTARPDVIITDLPVATAEQDYLLDCLRKNQTTSPIPVLALTTNVRQANIGPTCLRFANRCLLKRSPVNEILGAAIGLMESRIIAGNPAAAGDRIIRIDAVLSDLGAMPRSRSNKFWSTYRQRSQLKSPTAQMAQQQARPADHADAHHELSRTIQPVPSERLERYLHAPPPGL